MHSSECSTPGGAPRLDGECDASACGAGAGEASCAPGPADASPCGPAQCLPLASTPTLAPATPKRQVGHAPCGECVTCAVCLSPVALQTSSPAAGEVTGRPALVTLCQHTFHRECLVRCRVQRLNQNQLLPCPLCRATLPPGLTPSPRRRLVGRPLDAQPSRGDLVQRCRLAREAVSARWLSRQAELPPPAA